MFILFFFGTRKTEKSSRSSCTTFLCGNSIVGPRWTGGAGDYEWPILRVTPDSTLFNSFFQFSIVFFVVFLKKVFLIFLFFFSNIFHCWHQHQSLPADVSSVVGVPWRRDVLATWCGLAGIGLGHLLWREHGSTPQSGMEAPRLLKRSLSRLDFFVVVL